MPSAFGDLQTLGGIDFFRNANRLADLGFGLFVFAALFQNPAQEIVTGWIAVDPNRSFSQMDDGASVLRGFGVPLFQEQRFDEIVSSVKRGMIRGPERFLTKLKSFA